MHIGILTGEYPPMQGGIGAYTSILAGELATQGNRVAVLSRIGTRSIRRDIEFYPSIIKWNFASLNAIRAWVGEQKPDIINLQFQTAAFNMSPFIHLLPDVIQDVPIVTTFHDLRYPYLFPKAGGLRTWIVNHLVSRSTGVIVTNQEDYERIGRTTKTALIPIGSNILKPLSKKFDAHYWRDKAGTKPGNFLIAYFGLLNRSKGIETLLESLNGLHENGIPARLVMVGGGVGSSDKSNVKYAEEVQSKIEQMHLSDYVHWTGYLEDESDVGAYLAASDAVALPFTDGASYRRGSLMAPIRYGCAIVTTEPQVDIPLFRDGENMLLVPTGDSAALTNALKRLYETPEQGQRLRKGAAALSKNFEWPQIAKQTVEFFQQVLA